MPGIEKPRGGAPRGFLENGHHDDDQGQVYPKGALERRRAEREADLLVDAIRTVLTLLDRGEVPLDQAAATLDILSGRLATLALTGALVAA